MRYRAFRTKKNNLYYFQFLTEDGTVVMKSGSFADKAECFEGIRDVMQSAANAGRYSIGTNDNGKHVFTLQGENGLAGTSVEYDTQAAAEQAVALMQADGPTATSKSGGDGDGAAKAKPATASTETKKSTSSSDDYKPLNFYETRISGVDDGFDTFAAEDESYFTYNVDGMVLLISEGYSSEKGRDNGVNSVTKNMPNADRYQRKVHSNGKHYFNLRAGNNQEIATSRWFDDEAGMNTAIGILTSGGKGGGSLRAMFSKGTATSSGKIYKDYKPLGFYQERIAGEDFGFDPFAEGDKSYFTVNYDKAPLLISEDYTSESGRDNGIKSVKKNVKNDKRYVREVHTNGKHYFRLLAGNKQEIATSRWFDDEKEMEKAIAWLQSTGGTRRRKKPTRVKKEAVERTYVKQGASYPCSEITYDTFQSGGNQKYYFVFKTKEDKAILINGDVRGHADIASLDAAIAGVMKFAPDDKNYEYKETKNGKHYFYVKDDKGNSVARSSLFYADEDVMNAAVKMLACGLGMVKAAPAAPAPTGKKAIQDDYLPCDSYVAEDSGFHSFQDEENKEYYFSYNSAGGTTLLRSEGYTSTNARDNGIQSVIKNAPLGERWSTDTAMNGKYHFYLLKAGNHQEIARSCYYDSEDAMMADFNWIRGENSSIGAGSQMVGASLMSAAMIRSQQEEEAAKIAAATPAPTGKKAIQDDYLPCDSYLAEADGFHSFQDEENKEYYFSYNSTGGTTLLRSEGYTSTSARDNGIQSVIKNAPLEERWSTDTAMNGKYHFYLLKAGNHQEIARSCYYDSKDAMMADFNWVRGEHSSIGAGSQMVGAGLMSAAMLRNKKQEEDAEAARLAAEAKAKADAEAAAKAKAEEEARLAAAAKAKADEEARLALEAKAKAEADAAAKAKAAAAAAAAAAALAAKNKAAEEARIAAELEAKKKAEAEAKAKAEAEAAAKAKAAAAAAAAAAALAAKNKAAEEARIAAELEAKKKAEAAAKAKAAEETRLAAEAKRKADAAKAAAAAAALAVTAKAKTVKAETVNVVEETTRRGGLGWLWWLLPLLLLLLGLLWFLKGCDGCAPATVVPPVIVDTVATVPVEPREPFGPDCAALGYGTGTLECNMANYLSSADRSLPKTFEADGITFGKNSKSLNSKAKKQLDNLVALLKEYPDITVDIYGYIDGTESGTYRGSKEISLDDVRAREVYNYLKSRGIDESRMNFQGAGTNTRRGVDFKLNQR